LWARRSINSRAGNVARKFPKLTHMQIEGKRVLISGASRESGARYARAAGRHYVERFYGKLTPD
jgi:hypothetical protein